MKSLPKFLTSMSVLYSELVLHGYGVSKCKGVYPEGMNSEVSEESYFVVNLHNKKRDVWVLT